MIGVQTTSARLFYDFGLDHHVHSDHMLRSIDRHLNLDHIRQTLKPFYSSTGRPSIDPELMIRMLVVGYCMGIASERRLCEEDHLNLAGRWFSRLGLLTCDKTPAAPGRDAKSRPNGTARFFLFAPPHFLHVRPLAAFRI